jgi:hypothetical protein
MQVYSDLAETQADVALFVQRLVPLHADWHAVLKQASDNGLLAPLGDTALMLQFLDHMVKGLYVSVTYSPSHARNRLLFKPLATQKLVLLQVPFPLTVRNLAGVHLLLTFWKFGPLLKLRFRIVVRSTAARTCRSKHRNAV